MRAALRLRAPAKINLGLQVVGLRADGFHDIRTVYQSIALHDVVEFAPSSALTLTCSDPLLSTGEDNLVLRAARALSSLAGSRSRGALIHLDKRIPVQAGLGGGSSDAAMTLLGLSTLWNLQLTPRDLMGIGGELGSDVPFFLVGGTALGVGRGEELYPLPGAPPLYLVIFPSPKGVSTAEAYHRIDERLTDRDHQNRIYSIVQALVDGNLAEDDLYNHFEEVQQDEIKWTATVRRIALEGGAGRLLLAGSGSSRVAFFKDRDRALETAGKANRRGILCLKTRTLAHEDYWDFIANG